MDDRQKFMIRVIYKSGYTHDFPVYRFGYDGRQFTWEAADQNNKPVVFGADEVAAVYQVGVL